MYYVRLLVEDLYYTREPIPQYMALTATRGLHLYLRTLEAAVEDDIVTDDEMSILSVLARAFALPDDIIEDAWGVLRGNHLNPIDETMSSAHEKRQIGDATTYQTALIAALEDEVITEDEWSMLDVLRKIIGMQPDQHAMIEESIRAMSEVDDNGERRIERLNRFSTVCPFN